MYARVKLITNFGNCRYSIKNQFKTNKYFVEYLSIKNMN